MSLILMKGVIITNTIVLIGVVGGLFGRKSAVDVIFDAAIVVLLGVALLGMILEECKKK